MTARALGSVVLAGGLVSACGRIGFEAPSPPDARVLDPQTVTLALDRYDPGAGFADFMLPVFLTGARIDRGKLAPDASDVYFTDTAGALLPSEIEQIGDDAEPLIAWVRIADYNAGTVIQLHYGGDARPPATDPAWPASFLGVWHMNDGRDASLHANDGALHGTTEAAGLVGRARRFQAGDDDWIAIPDAPSLAFGFNQLTLSGWVDVETPPDAYGAILGRQDADTTLNDFNINVFTDVAAGSVSFTETTSHELSGGTVTAAAWHNVVFTYDGATEILYIDGAVVGTEPETRVVAHSANPVFIGADRNNKSGTTPPDAADSDFIDGAIDEVRLESVARSAAWIDATIAAAHDVIISYP